jgi:hypothetical protein
LILLPDFASRLGHRKIREPYLKDGFWGKGGMVAGMSSGSVTQMVARKAARVLEHSVPAWRRLDKGGILDRGTSRSLSDFERLREKRGVRVKIFMSLRSLGEHK